MRGMYADRTDAGWQTRTATITSSENVVLQDDAPLAGYLREHLTYNGAGGQLLSATLYDPWQRQTGRHDEDPYVDASPAINATFVRTGREQTRTWIAATGNWRRTDLTRAYDTTYGQQTLLSDLGDVTTTADDVCTSTTYARKRVRQPRRVSGRDAQHQLRHHTRPGRSCRREPYLLRPVVNAERAPV